MHKSTVSRILSTLQVEGLVSQNPETSKYRLGLGLISMAGVALGRVDVRGLAQPKLVELAKRTEETVNLTVLDGDECVNVDREASPKPIRYVGWIGRRTPLHCTASGKVILAYLPADDRRTLLRTPLQEFTDHTITDMEAFERSLEIVRQQGHAMVQEEFEVGFSAIAAPVFNVDGEVVATVSISGPSFRLDEGKMSSFIGALHAATESISASMGYSQSRKERATATARIAQ